MGNLFFDEPGVKRAHKLDWANLQVGDIVMTSTGKERYQILNVKRDLNRSGCKQYEVKELTSNFHHGWVADHTFNETYWKFAPESPKRD